MTSPSWGILGVGVLGTLVAATGEETEEVDTDMALGLTYFAMRQLLGCKLVYMAGWTIGLYALPVAFNKTRVASDYTSPAQIPTFTGYAPQSLAGWATPYLAGGTVVQTTRPLVVWTPTNALAPGPVEGFYVLDGLGNLVGVQENDRGTVIVGGDLKPFSVYPVFREQAIA